MKAFQVQLLLGVQHFLVDAICIACLWGPVTALCGNTQTGHFWVVFFISLYNLLAFCTQWMTGLACDLLKNDRLMHGIAAAALASGTICCYFWPLLGVGLIGMGNSLFHVVGGRYVIMNAHDNAGPLGMFVAPGALGLFIGGIFASFSWVFCCIMLINTVAICRMLKDTAPARVISEEDAEQPPRFVFDHVCLLAVVLILICISCRAASGAIPFPGKKIPEFWQWLPVLMVFAGKSLGGFIGDRLGYIKAGSIALIAGTVLLAFCSHPAGYITGQLLMNLLMALTLWQMSKVIPRYPGLAFGLAATVLVPGSWVRFSVEPLKVFLCLSGISLICFIITQMIIKRKKI